MNSNAAMWCAGLTAALLAGSRAGAADISGSVGLVSDYRYRGLSLSEGRPTIQAEIDVDAAHGFYGSLWASTIRNGLETSTELDLAAGKEIELARAITLDLATTYYAYPSARHDNYAEGTVTIAAQHGPLTGKVGISYAPPQGAQRHDTRKLQGNAYYIAAAELTLPKQPVKLSAQLGYERGRFDSSEQGGKWDWSITAETHFRALHFSVSYIDSDVERGSIIAGLALEF